MAFAVSFVGVWRGGPEIAMVVASSMALIVIIGSIIGMSLPFVLSRFKLEPVTASAPLVTSIADTSGVLIYFFVATTFLPCPVRKTRTARRAGRDGGLYHKYSSQDLHLQQAIRRRPCSMMKRP